MATLTNRQNKILGGLLGGAIGDSIGASTETRTIDLIKERFDGYVTDFVERPADNLSRGTERGLVTDDFSIAYFTAREILAANTRITEEIAKAALIKWWDDGRYLQFIGPTTRASILKMKGNGIDKSGSYELPKHYAPFACDNEKATNGAGMKVGVMGLFNPGQVDQAIDEALIMARPTHNNTVALAAGCAIAAATAQAMEEEADYMQVIQAGLYGAAEGLERSKGSAAEINGGNIEWRSRFAVELGLRCRGDFEKALYEISEVIGCGLYAYEAIPAVFGFLAASEGRAMEALYLGINCGDDTDTVACMLGFIVGALNGSHVLPVRHIELIDKENDFDLRQTAVDIDRYLTTVGGLS